MNRELYGNRVEFQVYGEYALFSDILTRPGGEKMSYPIPTYEALKGILSSVYWKPSLEWRVDRVRVMNRIRTMRKGVRPIEYGGGNQLAYYTYLSDVCYQVSAHFEWNMNRPELQNDRNVKKHLSIAQRMIERGGRRDIFLGTRECQGYVEPCYFGEGKGYYDESGSIPYGVMYHGITYADEARLSEDKGKMTVRLWNPVMENGIIEFISPEKCEMKRHIKDMTMKVFHNKENFSGVQEFGKGEEIELAE